jgi:hypothetical protein
MYGYISTILKWPNSSAPQSGANFCLLGVGIGIGVGF